MAQPNNPAAAAVIVFGAMALIALVDTFFFKIAEVAGLWQFHLIRALIALPVLWVLSRLTAVAVVPRKIGPVVARGACVSGSMILYFGSLSFLTVPQAAAGLFTAPLWVLVISAAFLRRRIGPRRLGAICAGFVGVLLVLQPDPSALEPGLALPIAAGFLYGLGAIATREWCAGETALSLLAAFFFCMIFFGAGGIAALHLLDPVVPPGPDGLILRAWGELNGATWFWILAQVVGAIVGVYGLTRAYQIAEATYVAVFEYAFLVFAAVWAVLLFADWPTGWEVLGIALIIGSGLLIAFSPATRGAGAASKERGQAARRSWLEP